MDRAVRSVRADGHHHDEHRMGRMATIQHALLDVQVRYRAIRAVDMPLCEQDVEAHDRWRCMHELQAERITHMTKVLTMKDPHTCSFCGYEAKENADHVILVVARDGRTAICSECVGIIGELIIEQAKKDGLIDEDGVDA